MTDLNATKISKLKVFFNKINIQLLNIKKTSLYNITLVN